MPNRSLTDAGDTDLRLAQVFWLRRNRGIFSLAAKKLLVSAQVVGQVYHGRRRSKRIERWLRRKGAPLAKQ